MPFVAPEKKTQFTHYWEAPVEKEVAPQTSIETAAAEIRLNQAAFRIENDIYNGFQYLTQPRFEADPDFNPTERLKADDLWDNRRELFIDAQSNEEYDHVAGKIRQEEEDRQILGDAGLEGIMTQIIAGVASPTILIPWIKGLRGAKAIAVGAGLGLAGGVLQEGPLQLNQITRTGEESLLSIGFSSLAGGVLGGAAAFANRSLPEIGVILAEGESGGMVGVSNQKTISSLGAAAAQEYDAGGLATALGAGEALAKISPVGYNLTSGFSRLRWITAQLADGGMELAGNIKGIPSALGGNAENAIRLHQMNLADGFRSFGEAFRDYSFDSAPKVFGQNATAAIRGFNPKRTKLNRQEFSAEVARAMRNNDEHKLPQVRQAAVALREKVFQPLFEEAQKLGILGQDIKVLGDASYLNRLYDTTLIKLRQPEFIGILTDHYNAKLQADFEKKFAKFQEKQARDLTTVDDLSKSADEVDALRKQFTDELTLHQASKTQELADLESEIKTLRRAARAAPAGSAARKDFLQQARDRTAVGGAPLEISKAKQAGLNRRLKNLSGSAVALEERQAAKLDRVDSLEQENVSALYRLTNKTKSVLKNLNRWSDEKLNSELSGLRDRFAAAAKTFDNRETRLAKEATSDDQSFDKLLDLNAAQDKTSARLDALAEQLEGAESLNREQIRFTLQADLDASIRRINELNTKRVIRMQKLSAAARKLDPEVANVRTKALTTKIKGDKQNFIDEFQTVADDLDIDAGAATFRSIAKEQATQITHKILGTHARLPGYDIIMGDKGAEMARVLDIAGDKLQSAADGKSFIVNDVENLATTYTATLGPDIEITKRIGSFTEADTAPGQSKAAINLEFKKLEEEYNQLVESLVSTMTAAKAPQAKIDKEMGKLAQEYEYGRRNLEAIIGRLRNTWGVPKDPNNMVWRMGKLMLNLNVLTNMGMVAVSSIPEMAQPILRYGALRAFRDGYIPMIKGMAGGNFTKQEYWIAQASLEMITNTRANQVFDLGDTTTGGTKLERGMEYGAQRMGVVALYSQWTTMMKQMAGTTATGTIMDSLRILNTGGSAKEVDKATRFLAAAGLDGNLAAEVWAQSQKAGGSDKVKGVWWPNLEAWDNVNGAQDAFQNALTREIERTIITPGVERPKMMDSSIGGRMIFQFQSFLYSSLTKTLVAGLQQRDMAVVTGAMVSVALGTLSYYTASMAIGGKSQARMETAMAEGDWGKFVDEGISKSGMLGPLSQVQELLSRLPGTSPYATISGEHLTSRQGSNVTGLALGPSFGKLETLSKLLSNIDDPTESTAHDARKLIMLQNHLLLRRGFTAVEQSLGLQKKRSEK